MLFLLVSGFFGDHSNMTEVIAAVEKIEKMK